MHQYLMMKTPPRSQREVSVVSRALNQQDEPEARTYEFSDTQLLKRMVGYLLRYPRAFAAVAGLVVLGIVTSVLIPFVLRQAIDVDFPSGDLQALMMTAALYVFLQILSWVSTYGSEYLMSWMGQNAIYDIRQELFSHLQVLSQDFYDESASGRVISRLTNDIDRMSELLNGGLINAFAQVFIVVAIGGVIFTVNTELALVTLAVVPLLLVSTIYYRKRLKAAYRQTRKTISVVTANLAESISGAKVTKSFARERINVENFDAVNRADYESNIDAGKAQSTFFPTIRFIGGLGTFLILWFGGLRLIQGLVTLGTVVMFIRFSDQFFRPILIISNFYTSVQSAFAGGERVFTVMDTESTVHDRPDAIEMPDVQGHIEFDDVTFSYVEGKNVLEDFNLEIQPGETIALVGDTGAGKTTVVSLLNRFYDVDQGSIKIDGIDIREVTLDSLQSTIGLVLQDSFLFMGTVRENIKYGRPDGSDEEVVEAIDGIGARRIIEGLENGLDTQVGERGERLSEGERQLVSFARALLADPRILVLDEATSSIDVYTEYAIQKGMKALLKNRTSIVIAHRLSTIVKADRILVLEDGEIVESGSHADLMKKRGKYYSLYELQIEAHQVMAG
ncbi:ABC transporter ATP-binding protein [Candidatus Thorarchaeota archaeon]|nr:MAG: ABC transporter ATP-binding protein [Candidatus Thorarchaeota archaeon]